MDKIGVSCATNDLFCFDNFPKDQKGKNYSVLTLKEALCIYVA